MGASSSNSSSQPVDVTPQSFKDLQQPLASQVGNVINAANTPQTTSNLVNGYQGPLTTPATANETQTLGQLQNFTNGLQTGAQSTGNTNQDTLLASQMANGGSAQNANSYAQQILAGNTNAQQDPTSYLKNLNSASNGAYSADPNNPVTQAYVAAAQRQTQQALQETLTRSLPSQFANAGQNVAPGTSSAFDRAAAIATRGSADALGDIATNINYNNMNDANNRAATALGQNSSQNAAAGLQTQNLGVNAAQQGQQNATAAAQQQTAGATANSNIQAQDVNTMVQNLQSQALPRLIQDLGVDRGMEAFNNNINSILGGLGIAAGVTRPVIGNSSSSSSGSINTGGAFK